MLMAQNSSIVVTVLQNILSWSANHIIEIIIFLSIFVEVSKIKVKPISALANFIFKPIRKEISELKESMQKDMESMEKRLSDEIQSLRIDQENEKKAIDELIEANEMSEISRIRWEIIEFSNSIGNNQLHVRDEYRHIIDEHKKYEMLIEKYGLENGIITEEIEKIKKHYEKNKDIDKMLF